MMDPSNFRLARDSVNGGINNNFSNNDITGGLSIPVSDDPATLINTSFAKVYTMPLSQSPRSWTQVTQAAVPVSFYFDKQRSVYRILSYDGDKLVINSTVTSSMNFSKPASAFALWTDLKLRTIFGLGFSSQAARDVAAEWFDKVVKAASNLEQSKTSMTMALPPEDRSSAASGGGSRLSVPAAYSDHSIDRTTNSLNNNGSSRTEHSHVSSITSAHVSRPLSLTRVRLPSLLTTATVPTFQAEHQNPTVLYSMTSSNAAQDSNASQKKLQVLEAEVSELKQMFSTTQQNLLAKITESDRLFQDIGKVKEELVYQISRADRAERSLKDEKERVHVLESELQQLKNKIAQQATDIGEVTERKRELEQEARSLRETLRLKQTNADETDKDLENMEAHCHHVAERVEEVLKIQERLRKTVNKNKDFSQSQPY